MTTINLLPWRDKAREKKKMLYFIVCFGVVLITFTLNLMWYMILQSRIDHQLARNIILQKETTLAKTITMKQKRFEEERTKTLSQITTLKNLNNQRVSIIELLEVLPKLLPEGVFLNTIDIEGEVISIEGDARTDTQVSDLMKKLKEQPGWQKIQLNEMGTASGSASKTTFKINLSLE